MWHRRRRRRLGVKTKHRKVLLRNLVRGLASSRRIITTHARAKETSRLADRMVTIAKEGTLAARRQLLRHLGSVDVANLFVDQIAPHFKDRQGGYTRVLKTAIRPGDGALKALVEFSVPIEVAGKKERKAKKEKKPKAPKPVVEEKEKKVRVEKPAPKEEKKEMKAQKAEKEEPEKKKDEKKETEKRGGFLSKLRKFLTGD